MVNESLNMGCGPWRFGLAIGGPNTRESRVTYEALRSQTAEMFGYVGDLTLTQGLQVDLASVLRLEIDALQGQSLAGQPVARAL
jgi:hypothetical protein